MQFTASTFRRRISEALPAKPPPGPHFPDSRETGSNVIDLSALWDATDNRQFLEKAYRRIFGREPDISGLLHNLALLENHVSRQKIVHQLINSEEATQRQRRFTGVREPAPARLRSAFGLRLFRSTFRHLVDRARDMVRLLLHARLDVIEHKIDYVLQELGSRSDAISLKTDQTLWSLSEKLNQSLAHEIDLHAEVRNQLNAAATANGQYAAETGRILEHCISLIELQKIAAVDLIQGEFSRLQYLLEKEHTFLAGELQQSAETLDLVRTDLLKKIDVLIQQQQSIDSAQQKLKSELLEQAKLAALRGSDVQAIDIDGFIIGIPSNEWRLAAFMKFRGMLEPGLTRLFQDVVRPGMVVVDVGANIGVYTLYAARGVGHTGKVFSFEPTPRIFNILRDNIQVNGFMETGAVTLRQAAVTDRRATADLQVFAQNSGHNTLFSDGRMDSLISVETVSLDDEIPASRVDVVKIDAEGAEPLILRGMQRIITNNPHIQIYIEFAPQHLNRAGVEPEQFLREIDALGFDVNRVDDLDGSLCSTSLEELVSKNSSNLRLTRRPSPLGAL